MSEWLNNKKPIHKPNVASIIKIGEKQEEYRVSKPCHELTFCPYGQLIEEFPFSKTERKCKTFGHDCPVYYLAEPITE